MKHYTKKTKEGVLFRDLLTKRGILPGIKVDKGTVPLLGSEETSTQGLDDLAKRCAKYYSEGCRFSKWRAVIKIGKNMPSEMAIMENAHGLARYAIICQENGLVPIVEPEILVDGPHDIETCARVSERVFSAVIKACQDYGLLFEGALLKPNMVTPGTECKDKVSAHVIAWMTVRTLSRTIPSAMPGIMFLSGGQSEEEASDNLNEMNKLTEIKRSWNLSFSYGRALQHSVLRKWLGKSENVKEAQDALIRLAKNNSQATLGKYVSTGSKGESLHVKNYVY